MKCCEENAMSNLLLKVKRIHSDAKMPEKACVDDNGYDLFAVDNGTIVRAEQDFNNILYIQYRTGIQIEPPPGYHTNVFPRSSISKYNLILANSVPLIDSGYNGEIILRFKIITTSDRFIRSIITDEHVRDQCVLYKKGDKIGQIVLKKNYDVEIQEVDFLTETDRGSGGFGSTGQ